MAKTLPEYRPRKVSIAEDFGRLYKLTALLASSKDFHSCRGKERLLRAIGCRPTSFLSDCLFLISEPLFRPNSPIAWTHISPDLCRALCHSRPWATSLYVVPLAKFSSYVQSGLHDPSRPRGIEGTRRWHPFVRQCPLSNSGPMLRVRLQSCSSFGTETLHHDPRARSRCNLPQA